MATRLYFGSGTATTPISPAVDGSWETSAGGVRRGLHTTKVGGAMASVAVSTTLNSPAGAVDGVACQFISPPLQGSGTIAAAISGQMRMLESAAAADMRVQVCIRVLSEDGTTVRGTLVAHDASALAHEFDATTLTNRKLPFGSPVTPTAVAYQDKDRLVVEIGYRKHENAVTSRTATFRIGDPSAGSDLAVDETTTTDDVPWIEFADDFLFYTQVEFVAGTSNSSTGTSMTSSVPGGTVNGCLLLMFFEHCNGGSPTTNGYSSFAITGGGWIRLYGWQDDPFTGCDATFSEVWYRIAASEPASYTVTWTNLSATTGASVQMLALRGNDTADPILAIRGTKSFSSDTTPSWRLAEFLQCYGFMGVQFLQYGRASETVTTPSGYTLVAKVDNGNSGAGGILSCAAYQQFNTRSDLPAGNWTMSAGGTFETWSVVVRPSGQFPLAMKAASKQRAFSGSGTTYSPDNPPDYHAGDLVVAHASGERTGTTLGTVTPSAGWTQLTFDKRDNDTGGKSYFLGTYYRIMDGSGSDTLTLTFSQALTNCGSNSICYPASPTAPAVAASNHAIDSTSDTTQNIPSCTVEDFDDDVLDVLVLATLRGDAGQGAWDVSGYNRWWQYGSSNANNAEPVVWGRRFASANPGSATVTSTGANTNCAAHYVVAARRDGAGARTFVVMV